ncbi:MAG: DtxR family transcriptional regulator [candidate division KSB1 bacterium]|nr:DtxR family transcriptional regulator [candidate division KSB1 bacterium]MDZ7274801.1 DtxR family transcriptional regulator [candidate division KSB1 bacterium]MDZ7298658.1 DtxR family transcriptional regulator [candidate division KSB1 bacterium]MDZ7307498.1 DtxR family transcriptional regulator [candidate division KSB1 bacterium]MDZ7349523.1 DtxR family transcriptional regulator [candidate division KSB1 bacterium]
MALLTAFGLLALAAIVLWPNYGLLVQWQKLNRTTQKVLIEDALKHLYHQEEKGQRATLESLSGALSISRDQAARLLTKLESLGLIISQQNGFGLTAEGRSDALRIIRVHRLWERYFADETGLAATEWHNEAERREHITTAEEAEKLARQMSNPLHDPHGDPIPTSGGELPAQEDQPLTDLPVGELARIVHIEDEPAVIYAQLSAEGLHPGMIIRVLDKSPERIQFIANGEEFKLAPVAAANVSVVPLTNGQEMEGPFESLSALKTGETGVVLGISRNCRGLQRRRLMDLGIVPGTTVTAELSSPSGNPMAYNIRGALIALRREQASHIYIQRKEKEA